MRFYTQIKPRIVKGLSKSILLSKIQLGQRYWNKNGGGYYYTKPTSSDIAICFNIEKHNKKTKQTKFFNDKTNRLETKSKVIKDKHWVAYIYEIPVRLIEFNGLTINQGSRTFKITKKNK